MDNFGDSGYHIAQPYNFPRIPIGIYPHEKSLMKGRHIINEIFKNFGAFKLFDGLDLVLSTIAQDGLTFYDLLVIISEFKRKIKPAYILHLLPTIDHINQGPKEGDAAGKDYEKYRVRLSNLISEGTLLALTVKLGESLPNFMNTIVNDINSELVVAQKEFIETNPNIAYQVRTRESMRKLNKVFSGKSPMGMGMGMGMDQGMMDPSMGQGMMDPSMGQGMIDQGMGMDQGMIDQGMMDQGMYPQGGGSARTAAIKRNIIIDPKEDYEVAPLLQPANIDLLAGIGMLKYFKDKRIRKTDRMERVFKRYKTDWSDIKSKYLSFLQKNNAIKEKYRLVFVNFETNRVKDWTTDFENHVIENIIENSETLLNWFRPGTLTKGT